MLIIGVNKYFNHRKFSGGKLLLMILLVFWQLNFLINSLLSSSKIELTEPSPLPIHFLHESDLTSPEKIFLIQNETLRIAETIKVKAFDFFNIGHLIETGLNPGSSCKISVNDEKDSSPFVFIELTNPRSPPSSLI